MLPRSLANLKRRKLVKGQAFSVRFVKQTDHFSCAAIAVLNALKLKGWMMLLVKSAGSGGVYGPQYLGINAEARQGHLEFSLKDIKYSLKKYCKCKDETCGSEIIVIEEGLAC